MAKTTTELWEILGQEIPVKIIKEWRRNNSISIGRQQVTLRLNQIDASVGGKQWQIWAYRWLENTFESKPDVLLRFASKTYVSGQLIHTPRQEYLLDLAKSDRKTSAARLIHKTIRIELNEKLSKRSTASTCETLIARVVGKHQLADVSKRIEELNFLHFQQPIHDIRIKNNSSNWGSCSNKGIINISARTLLAPLVVQDYIFIHELAHLIELNHSRKYWSNVAKAMPDYKKYERWIKHHGDTCNY